MRLLDWCQLAACRCLGSDVNAEQGAVVLLNTSVVLEST
jgi:hypothetical protein